ncbi:MAG: hypothetical protein R3C39_10675 [Dehalococcoidia bacterium]
MSTFFDADRVDAGQLTRTAWAVRHRSNYRWLRPMWASGARYSDRLADAFQFRERRHAELVVRQLRQPVEVLEVERAA